MSQVILKLKYESQVYLPLLLASAFEFRLAFVESADNIPVLFAVTLDRA
jgi:hypothetical protein